MGLDLSAYPVQLDSPELRLLRTDPLAWEDASTWPPFSRADPLLRELEAALPDGMDCTYPYPDRSYNQAEYLLDPVAYRRLSGFDERERSLPYRIILGDRLFADHARGGQGVPWRCSTAAFLIEAADVIDALDVAAVRREFSVADMVEQGIYKVDPTCRDDEQFARVLRNLRRLALYYRAVAARGLDLIIEQD